MAISVGHGNRIDIYRNNSKSMNTCDLIIVIYFFFFSGKWCCICLGVGIDSEQKYNHGCDSNKNGKNSELLLTRKHLSSVEDVETLRSIIRYVYIFDIFAEIAQ